MNVLARLWEMNVTKQLKDLRQGFDNDLGAEVPAALLLSDVCRALGLTEAAHREVLGEEGSAYVEDMLGDTVTLIEQRESEHPVVAGYPEPA